MALCLCLVMQSRKCRVTVHLPLPKKIAVYACAYAIHVLYSHAYLNTICQHVLVVTTGASSSSPGHDVFKTRYNFVQLLQRPRRKSVEQCGLSTTGAGRSAATEP